MCKRLQKKIGYFFKDTHLLEKALRHASYTNEQFLETYESNERLEFLGDALLGLVIAEYLFNEYPTQSEGRLSVLKAHLVSRDFLTEIAQGINLGEYVKLGKGEEKSKGRSRDTILSCTLEALIAAVYLDSDFMTMKKVVLYLFADALDSIDVDKEENSKSRLQKYAQMKFKITPTYTLIKEQGPSHNKLFEVGVVINGQIYGKGVDSSKKKATMKAAQAALHKLDIP